MELFFSVDIEASGPIPGPNYMMSIGMAAFNEDGEHVGSFSSNLAPLPNSGFDQSTRDFWNANPQAYAVSTRNPRDPALVMPEAKEWVLRLAKAAKAKPVFVAYPLGFDFMWSHWYFINFAGDDPFGISGIDVKTYAATMLKSEFRKTTKKTMPKNWFQPMKNTHVAVDDAIEQGHLFMAMRKENLHR